jgi:hypothetical protein
MKNHTIRTMSVLTLVAMLSLGAGTLFAFETCATCVRTTATLSYAPAAQPTLLSVLLSVLSSFWI